MAIMARQYILLLCLLQICTLLLFYIITRTVVVWMAEFMHRSAEKYELNLFRDEFIK